MRPPSMDHPSRRRTTRRASLPPGDLFSDVLRGSLHNVAAACKLASVDDVRNVVGGAVTSLDKVGRALDIVRASNRLTLATARVHFITPLEDYFRVALPTTNRCVFTSWVRETNAVAAADPAQAMMFDALEKMNLAQLEDAYRLTHAQHVETQRLLDDIAERRFLMIQHMKGRYAA